jgi:hypothetical protein
LLRGVVVAVQASSRPCPSASSRRSWRWSVTRPQTNLGCRGSVDPGGGRRTDRPALWPVAGAHHRWWGICAAGVQPPAAAAAGPGAGSRGGRPLAGRGVPRHPCPGEAGGWGGVVAGRAGVGSDAAAGRSWAPIGQTPVVKRTGKRFRVNMISTISKRGYCGSGCLSGPSRGGVHRLPAPAATGSRRAKGPPDRGWASGTPGQAGQRLGWAPCRPHRAALPARLQPRTEPR